MLAYERVNFHMNYFLAEMPAALRAQRDSVVARESLGGRNTALTPTSVHNYDTPYMISAKMWENLCPKMDD